MEVEDTSFLSDADWAELNKLKRAHQKGGKRALSKAVDKLTENDRGSYVRIMAAFFPSMVRNAVKDAMAQYGVTEEELRELIRKCESPAGKQ